jgi:hypothetical protein
MHEAAEQRKEKQPPFIDGDTLEMHGQRVRLHAQKLTSSSSGSWRSSSYQSRSVMPTKSFRATLVLLHQHAIIAGRCSPRMPAAV